MSTTPRSNGEIPRDEPLERALRQVVRPAARPEFKARLRAEFLAAADRDAPAAGASATVGQPAPSSTSTAARPTSSSTTAQPTLSSSPTIARPRRLPIVPFVLALAAASVIAMFFLRGREATPAWRALQVQGDGTVLIDGVAVDVGNTDKIAELLVSAREFDSREAKVRLTLRDQVALELAPNTRLAQMSFPAAGLYSVRVEAGAMSVCTGPKFQGERMKVLSRDLDVDVVGTAFAIDVYDAGTCACCLEGKIDARPRPVQKSQVIDGGKMCFAFAEEKPAMWGDAKAMHLTPTIELQTWVRENWK